MLDARTHDQIIEARLRSIQVAVWVVAGAVLAGIVAGVVVFAAATAAQPY